MKYDILIIGGGFYGMYLANFFSNKKLSVLVLEKENDILTRASQNNQARVHNGYHYPRSITTALQSSLSYPKFVNEFKNCVHDEFDNYYLISNFRSKVTHSYFENICQKIKIPLLKTHDLDDQINHNNIRSVYKVKEGVFDFKKIKNILLDRIKKNKIEIIYNADVENIKKNNKNGDFIVSTSFGEEFKATKVINCTYSGINLLHQRIKIPLINLKHEITETCIVKPKGFFKNKGLTVMCGPFFSTLPFPAFKGRNTFTHVAYTPHYSWNDTLRSYSPEEMLNNFKTGGVRSNWKKMILDASKYITNINDFFDYERSNWEVKTIVSNTEFDDARPILYKTNFYLDNYDCILGAKIDNVYDVLGVLK